MLTRVATAEGLHVVEVGADAVLVGVLSHAYCDHLTATVGAGDVLVLGIDLQPAPLLVGHRAAAVAGLTGTEGEELPDLVEDAGVGLAGALGGEGVGVAHDHGLAVQHIPQVGIQTGLVDVLVQGAEHTLGGLLGAEVEHEGYLGHLDAVGLGLPQALEERLVGRAPGQGTVGAVKEQEIHTCRRQQGGVMADNVGVGVAVEAVEGLVPVGLEGTLPPGGVILAVLGGGVLIQHLHHVHGAEIGVTLVPGPVEDTHLLVLLFAHVLHRRHLTAQHIGGLPGVVTQIQSSLLRDGLVGDARVDRLARCLKGQQLGTAAQGDGHVVDPLGGVDLAPRLGVLVVVAGEGDDADVLAVGLDVAQGGVARVGEADADADTARAEVYLVGPPELGLFIEIQFCHVHILAWIQSRGCFPSA